jgi:hypothetical protein
MEVFYYDCSDKTMWRDVAEKHERLERRGRPCEISTVLKTVKPCREFQVFRTLLDHVMLTASKFYGLPKEYPTWWVC